MRWGRAAVFGIGVIVLLFLVPTTTPRPVRVQAELTAVVNKVVVNGPEITNQQLLRICRETILADHSIEFSERDLASVSNEALMILTGPLEGAVYIFMNHRKWLVRVDAPMSFQEIAWRNANDLRDGLGKCRL